MRVLATPAYINRWLNPYNWLLNTHLERLDVSVVGAASWRVLRGTADAWHLHWPEHAFSQRSAARATFSARVLLRLINEAKRDGVRIVWTVHNLRVHDGRHGALEEAFWEEFLPLVDGVIHLSEAGAHAAVARFPALADRPSWVIPHGHYRGEYPVRHDAAAARHQLHIPESAPVVGFVGRVRGYKNVPALLTAFRDVAIPEARCLIAGAVSNAELLAQLRQQASADNRVRIDARFLRRAELAVALQAMDLVVLPYREILNSGSALLALSLNRPVLVPRQGALGELAEQVGAAWVRCYDGPLTSAILGEAMEWARCEPRSALAPLGRFAWPAIARAHRSAFRSLCGVEDRDLAPARGGLPSLLAMAGAR